MKSNEIGTGYCVSFTMPPGGHVFLNNNFCHYRSARTGLAKCRYLPTSERSR